MSFAKKVIMPAKIQIKYLIIVFSAITNLFFVKKGKSAEKYEFKKQNTIVEYFNSKNEPPICGVIRWDWWQNFDLTTEWLSPKKYHYKLPFFAKEIGDDTINIEAATKEIMDQEIEYAHSAGIDYFAFNYYADYGDTANGSYGYNLFKKSNSANKTYMKFCYIVEETSVTNSDGSSQFTFNSNFLKQICTDMGRDDYQKVLNGRPLFYYFSYPLLTFQKAKAINETYQIINPGKPLPYLVNMREVGGEEAKLSQSSETAQAHSQYVYNGNDGLSEANGNYEKMAESDWRGWNRYKNAGAKLIPTLSTGWDTNPIFDAKNKSWYIWSNNKSEIRASKNQIKTHLQATIDFIIQNPTICEANTFLCYAWNEHAEGGYICPTLMSGSNSINTDYVDAFREVLRKH